MNNITTGTNYSDDKTMVMTPPRRVMTLVVTNAAIFYQFSCSFGLRGGEQFQPETFVPPGRYFFDEGDLIPGAEGFSQLKVRSAVAGISAQVSAT